MFFRKKPKTPFFDRLTGTTTEKVASYVEAHKDRQDVLLESSILLLAMNCAGYFLSKELPPALNRANREVLAFEMLVFSFSLLRDCFDALDSGSDIAHEAFGSAYVMGTALVARETGWDVADLFGRRMMQYSSGMSVRKSVERFLGIARTMGTAAHPSDKYGGVAGVDLMADLTLVTTVTSYATTIPKAAAETLQNINTEYGADY